MSDPKKRCLCKLSDCAYYNSVPGHPEQCDCSHADKGHYMVNPCPLYRKNWAAASTDAARIRELMLKKRKAY